MLAHWVAGKPELFEREPEIDSTGDRVLVALPNAGRNRGLFTVAWFRQGLIARMQDFDRRRKANAAF